MQLVDKKNHKILGVTLMYLCMSVSYVSAQSTQVTLTYNSIMVYNQHNNNYNKRCQSFCNNEKGCGFGASCKGSTLMVGLNQSMTVGETLSPISTNSDGSLEFHFTAPLKIPTHICPGSNLSCDTTYSVTLPMRGCRTSSYKIDLILMCDPNKTMSCEYHIACDYSTERVPLKAGN